MMLGTTNIKCLGTETVKRRADKELKQLYIFYACILSLIWVQLMTVSYETVFYRVLFVKSFYSYDMHVLFEEHKNKSLLNGKHTTSITVIVYKNKANIYHIM